MVLVPFVRGTVVGDVFPFRSLSGLCLLQNGPYVQIVQLFPSQSGWIPADCDYGGNSSYLLDVCPDLNFGAVRTLLFAGSSGKDIGIVTFSAITVLGSEVLLL